MLDLMRLPLGILSGMGFIGAGAILRRGNVVMGVTTAATLWYVTVMGLCFGGGQLALGLAMLVLGIIVLWTLKWFEDRLKQDCHGVLRLRIERDALSETDVRALLAEAGLRVRSCAVRYDAHDRRRHLRCDLRWHGPVYEARTPEVIERLAEHEGVSRLDWLP
jgi:putative Mg2+ transporter-C (MgtC) family protein